MSTNFSQGPYFDSFSSNDQFQKILFRPAVAVQTRELNELSSILQNQIEKFGRNIFRDGSVVEGCSFSFDNRYSFVKINDNYANGTAFTISNFKNSFLVNENGLRAVIVNTVQGFQSQDPFTNVLYIKYLTSATFTNGVQQSVFSNSEQLSLQTDAGIPLGNVVVFTPNVANPNSVATGLSYALMVGAGTVFKNGYFTTVEPQTCIVSPFSNYPDGISVGFNVQENIITPEANTALCDNSVGSPNYLAPGAHRFQVIPVLTTMQTNNISNTTLFFSLCDFQNGVPITLKNDPQYALIGAEMARRTYETSGDFVVNPFILTTEPKNSSDPLFATHDNLVSSLGLGYVKGYRNEFLASVVTPLRKATDFVNALATSTTASFGSFVTVTNFCGDFNTGSIAQIELHNANNYAVTNNTFLSTSYDANTLIGTAYLRGFAFNNGYIGSGTEVYIAYPFNIQMQSGCSFSQVKSLIYRPSSTILAIADVIQTEVKVNSLSSFDTISNTTIYDTISNTIVSYALQPIPPLPAPIVNMATATLGNGSIITVGGFHPDWNGVTSCYIYNPNNNEWNTLPSFPRAVGEAAAATLANGSVIAGGGYYGITANTWSPYFYRYDPGANTWTQIASIPLAVSQFGLATLGNGSILSVGGQNTYSTDTNHCYRYDPGANTWTQVANLPESLGGIAAGSLTNGSVISVGGEYPNVSAGYPVTVSNCYRYDSGANTWTQIASLPEVIGNFSAALIPNGHIITVGGRGAITDVAGGQCLANCYSYDPVGNTWSKIASLPTTIGENGSAVLANGAVLSITGMLVKTASFIPSPPSAFTQNCYLYDSGLDQWKTTISIPTFTDVSNVVPRIISTVISTVVTNATIGTVLSDSAANKMIYPIGQKSLKLDGFQNQSFVYRKKANSSFSNTTYGVMTINLGSPVGSAVENFDEGGFLSSRAEETFIIIPSANGTTTNMAGTVNVTSSSFNVTGVSTAFLAQYAKGDYIKINNYMNQINTVSNNTFLTLTTPYIGTTAVSNVHCMVFPKGVPISFNRVGRSVVISGNTATFTLGEALLGTFNAVSYFDIRRSYASPIKKNLKKNVYVAIDCGSHPNGTQGPYSLGFADVYKINAIYFNDGSFSNTVSNFSFLFKFDKGQRDDRYELASITPIAHGVLNTSSKLLVDLDMFTYDQSQGVGFFTGNSYPVDDVNISNTSAFQTQYIPQYTSSDGSSFDLRDCVDFRPFANNSADSTANSINWASSATINPSGNLVFYVNPTYGSYLPSPDSSYIADIQHYLPRVDKAVLTTGGQFTIIEGEAAPKPLPPFDISKAMTIGLITVPPYPTLATSDARASGRYDYAVTVSLTQNQRFTMANIGALSDRVNQLEYYTSLNSIEQLALNALIPSSQTGQTRFQNGFLVDPFQGTNITDTLDPAFNCAIDPIRKEMRPAFSTFTKALWTNKENVPFNENQYIFQQCSSVAINTSDSAWCYVFGRIELRPEIICSPDFFQDPDISNNLDLNASWVNISCRPNPSSDDWRNPYGTDWEHWRHYPAVISNNSVISGNTDSYGNVLTEYQSRRTANVASSGLILGGSAGYNSNGITIDTDVIDYTRCRDIDFVARGMKANTAVRLFVGAYEMTNLCRQCSKGFAEETFKNYGSSIITDSTGTVFGRITIPSGYFKEGSIQFTFLDSPTNITTRADGYLQTSFTDSNNWKDIDISDQLADYERETGMSPVYLPGQTIVLIANTPFLYNRTQGGNDLVVWQGYTGNTWLRFPSQSSSLNMDNDWNPAYLAQDGYHSFDRKGSDVGRVSYNVVPHTVDR